MLFRPKFGPAGRSYGPLSTYGVAQPKPKKPDILDISDDIDEVVRRIGRHTPSLDEVWAAWGEITEAADPWLDAATTQTLESNVMIDGKPSQYLFGSLLQRTIYHYWYHIGENAAIRQNLGHTALPDFVGDIDGEAPYRAEVAG